jgi:hypothetical protein
MCKQTTIVLEESGIVIAIADPFVQDKFHVDILSLYHGAIFLNFNGPAFAAESTETGNVTEIVQVVVDGRNA